MVLAGSFLSSAAGAWTSARVHPSGSGLAYTYDAEGTRIPDFSYAGYEEGCQPLPGVIPVVMTLTPVAGDNTNNINHALAAVAAMPVQPNGFRGALLLRPGTYDVAGVVRLGGGGVVLRGSGSGTDPAVDSILFSTRTDTDPVTLRGEYSVVVLGNIPYSNNGLRGSGPVVDITTPWVKVGDDSFQVADATPFAVGDIIVINQPITDAWLATVDYGGTASAPNWPAGGSIVQERRITAIDAATRTIHIAGGSFQHLKLALGQCSIAKLDTAHFAQHSGIEDLHVDITHTSMTDEDHAKNAITVMQAMHCWVRNTACRYYWHSAVMAQSSLYCSVRGNVGSDFAGIVTGERGYTFSAEGNASHILFTGNAAYGGRHNYICNTGFTNSGVVFYDNDSYNGLVTIEAHMHWSMGILFDNLRDYNSSSSAGIGLYNCGDYGTNHGWACANCVLWNSLEEKQNIIIQKPPTAQNYAIGCTAGRLITGLKPPAPFSQPTGYVEGSNTAGLVPASLYLAQLAARSDCPRGTPSLTPTPSRTATPSATPSPTPSASRTVTASQSPTRTGTATRSATASATVTLSPTPSASRTATPSPSPTRTATPTASASTPTPSATPSPTSSASRTVTASQSPTGTGTATRPATASATVTLSTTPSASGTPTASPSPTRSAHGSATASPSSTRTATPKASASTTFTATPTASPVSAAAPSLTAPAPLALRRALPLPNPNPRSLWVDIAGPVDRVRISLWSVNLAELAVVDVAVPGPGAHTIPLPPSSQGLAAGVYFYRVEAFAGRRQAEGRLGSFLCLP